MMYFRKRGLWCSVSRRGQIGKALSGFVRKTAPEIKTYAVETCADIEALGAALKGEG